MSGNLHPTIAAALAPYAPRDPNLREGPREKAWPTTDEAIAATLRANAVRIQQLQRALQEADDLIRDYVDINGNGGPNAAMQARTIIDDVLLGCRR